MTAREEWFSRPAETEEDHLVLALLPGQANTPSCRIHVEEPFGGSAWVCVQFEGDSWKQGARAVEELEIRARERARLARRLAAEETAAPEEVISKIELLGEIRRFAVPAP
ncbi:MAG: hypothetical protein IT186_21745 [Acidobacteria bacterium]|nr:hypothetical protein [Acidobacteriota bacterium]